MKKVNIYGQIPRVLEEEWTEELLRSDTIRIERIVSRGHRSPEDFWFEQGEWLRAVRRRSRDDGAV